MKGNSSKPAALHIRVRMENEGERLEREVKRAKYLGGLEQTDSKGIKTIMIFFFWLLFWVFHSEKTELNRQKSFKKPELNRIM